MGVLDFIIDAKNKMLANIIIKKANEVMEGVGEMLNFQLDTKNKNIYFEIMLKGESEPIKISLLQYEFIKKNEKQYIMFQEIYASRVWIDLVLKQFILPKFAHDNLYELPQSVLKYLPFAEIIV